MLVDHLLFSVRVHDNDKIVESADDAAHLEAVYQEYCDNDFVTSCLIEENVL